MEFFNLRAMSDVMASPPTAPLIQPNGAAPVPVAAPTGEAVRRPHLLSLSLPDLETAVRALGEPTYRAKQIWSWIYDKKVVAPQAMANLPHSLREKIGDAFETNLPEIESQLDSDDGSTKLLLATPRGRIEAVILRYEGRTSLCVSSQVGCRMACRFCQTGKLGIVRDLRADEILAQYLLAAQITGQEGRRLSHVVFMGMGEPLDNYDAVTAAARVLVDPKGFGLSARHVTISTSGVVPRIRTLATDARVALAISLHAARDELRTELMPINRKWPLTLLKAALVDYQKQTGDKITIEYILIKDKTAGLQEARELVQFLAGLRAKVNLIPFNSHPGLPYERPDDETIRAFQTYLADRSIPAPVRYSKGLDVSAACGQLAAKTAANLMATPARASALNH